MSGGGDMAAAPIPRRRKGRLFVKYVLSFVVVGSVLLAANSGLNMWFDYREYQATAIRLQHEKAQAAAGRIEQFVAEIERQVGWTTHAQWAAAPVEQRRFDYVRLLRQVPAITELAQLDNAGKEQLRVSRLAMDAIGSQADFSSDPRFTEAMARRIWFGAVYFRKESEPYMTMAMARSGRNAGVTVAEINLKLIWDVITQIKVGESGYAYVVDQKGRLIAHPDISLVLRNTDLSKLPQVAAALARPTGEAPAGPVEAADLSGRAMLSSVAAIPQLGWLVFVDLPRSEALAPLWASLWQTLAILATGLGLAMLAALWLARRMVGPIQALQAGAAQIGAGDLGKRIVVSTNDELETLADRFNDMAGKIQEAQETLEQKVKDRTADLNEALEILTATAGILKAIAASPADVSPVLQAIVESTCDVCNANDAAVLLKHGGDLCFNAHRGPIPIGLDRWPINRNWVAGRAVVDKKPVHVRDLLSAEGEEFPDGREFARRMGHRTILSVPLLHRGESIGAIAVRRVEVQPFNDKQIALLSTFADQAVIAIENTRLFEETQARTRELSESLEHQTATSEVLQIISRSPADLEPVFQAMLQNAIKICQAQCGILFSYDGAAFHPTALCNVPPEFVEYVQKRGPTAPSPETGLGRLIATRRPVHIDDVTAEDVYKQRHPLRVATAELAGVRTWLGVPMLKGEAMLGAFVIYRKEVHPFSEKQIELVSTFANQAVIAIENARLLNELRESLEQQTATAEVLKVISRSPFDLEPVLQSLLETAAKLGDAEKAWIGTLEVDAIKIRAALGMTPDWFTDAARRVPASGRGSAVGRALADGVTCHVPDTLADDSYTMKDMAELMGYRSVLAVPLLREGRPLGVIAFIRNSVRPFSRREIELAETFADQAVIAIANVRLFKELRARRRELKASLAETRALGEVGRAVSSTLELSTVLQTIAAHAVPLSGADAGAFYAYDADSRTLTLQASYRFDEALLKALAAAPPVRLGEAAIGRAAERREAVQFADIEAEAGYSLRPIVRDAGFRALLAVPMLREDTVIGALVVCRRTPGEFPKETVDLVQSFANQSVLPIQNAQLYREIEEKGRQLEVASQHKSQFLANMSHELRTPLNAILGYTELILDGLYGDLTEKSRGVLERVQANGKHLLGLINDVLDLAKIEAGQLTLSVAEYSVASMVQSVVAATESLARAKGLALASEVAPGLPLGAGDERRLTQVLLNIVGNAIKFTDTGSVTIGAGAADGFFTLYVRDTGPGIPVHEQSRIFEEFQQVDSSNTRKKGGTGLGLAISKRIVEMHGGTIGVESTPGRGATFQIHLPVKVAGAKEVA